MSSPESKFDSEERDRIAGLTRDALIAENSEAMADVMWDDGHKDQEGLVVLYRDGLVGYKHYSTRDLRDELYDAAMIPEEHRLYQPGDDPGPALTVGALIEALYGKEPQWLAMMRHDLDGDVIIGARIVEVKEDGFYQHVNLIGPINDESKAKLAKKARRDGQAQDS